jgi:hypothetical protein
MKAMGYVTIGVAVGIIMKKNYGNEFIRSDGQCICVSGNNDVSA